MNNFKSLVVGLSTSSILLSLPVCYAGGITEQQPRALTTQSPNIILFYVDDLGWMDLGCHGSEFYETPAIDKLAEDGIRYTNGYTAHPRCVPARYGLVTGRFPARGGVPGPGSLKPDDYTIGEAMRDGGYSTFYIGKWHLIGQHGMANHPRNQGFETALACGKTGYPKSYFYPYRIKGADSPLTDEAAEGLVSGIIPDLDPGGNEDEYLTDRITHETIKYITEHQKTQSDKPFFACVSHYGVHTPLQAQKQLIEKYEKKLKSMKYDRPNFVKDHNSDTKMRQNDPVYAAMVESVDRSLARINQTLEELNIAENTVVIFTADNGGLSNRGDGNRRQLATSNFPLRTGKGWCYEGGIREPLIIKWPKVIAPGRVSDAVVAGTDIYPTLLELAGSPLRPQDHVDGVSFVNSIKGKPYRRSKPVFWYSPRPRPESTGDTACGAVRLGDYKLIEWSDRGSVELYNISEDIGEQNNLSDALPEKRKELLGLLKKWKHDIDACKPRNFKQSRKKH